MNDNQKPKNLSALSEQLSEIFTVFTLAYYAAIFISVGFVYLS